MTKPTKWHVRPAKIQISLGIRPVWSESLLFAWRKLGSLATHWVHSEDWSDWANAQVDLSLRWVHSRFAGFVTRQLNDLFTQPRPWSACASAQSDQSLLSAQSVAKYPRFLHAKTLIRLHECTASSKSLLGTPSSCWWLISYYNSVDAYLTVILTFKVTIVTRGPVVL